MTFSDWQALSPGVAAREVHRRILTQLPPAQQQAAIAAVATGAELEEAFTQAPHHLPLSRVPFFSKDLFPVAGQPMYAGSTFLPEVKPVPTHDGALIRTLRGAGAVLAGRTHLHEFAYGITGENPHYGDCEHPRFPGRTTGGSSSGSAALVAAGVVPLATASDTGGSVRLPAAFCGLFGIRLTPRDALIADAFPLAPSYDTAGWFTRSAGDMATVVGALLGEPASQSEPRGCYLELPGLDPEVARACQSAARQLAPPADATTRDGLLAVFATALDAYHTVVADEAWAVHRPWAERFRKEYDPAVWQRLDRTKTLTAAQRESAQHATAAIKDAWAAYFSVYNFLVLPASPCPALTKEDCTPGNRGRILTLTAPASIGGRPVLTVPVPLPAGLTTGLQIVVATPQSPVVPWVLGQW